jgi:hypothetical protein
MISLLMEILMYFDVNLSDRPTFNEPPLPTYRPKLEVQGNKCTLTICLILRSDFMDKFSRKSYKNIAIWEYCTEYV